MAGEEEAGRYQPISEADVTGRALRHAYRGELSYLCDPQRHSLRVRWTC